MNKLNVQAQRADIEYIEPANPARARVREVWLGVNFPDISLTDNVLSGKTPHVVLQSQQGKKRIYHCNTAARERSLEAGMGLNAAYALCSALNVSMRDKQAELNQLERYAQLVGDITPRIALSSPDTLLLEVRASLRLFGGSAALYRRLKNIFNVRHTIACAPVANAAELMARLGIEKVVRDSNRLQSALGVVLIAQTSIAEKLAQQLAHCGLFYLRDIWRLPRPDLARRFGPALLDYLDLLSGQTVRPSLMFEPKERFKARHDFDQETHDFRYVLYAAERLLQQAQQFLQQRASLSEEICFCLFYARSSYTVLPRLKVKVYAQQGGDSPAHFLPQFTEQLQRLEFKDDLNSIELHIDQFKSRSDYTRDLFKKASPSSDNWSVLLNLLLARLGRKRVYKLTVIADHRPERAWRKRAAHHLSSSRSSATEQASRIARPAWLFHQPLECLGQRFTLISDAERLESGWWGGEDQRREYYQGIAPSGCRCWLYRDLQATRASGGQWYLHGLFA
jgi:protein ImuB